MLTIDILKQNASLAQLTDEQLGAIAEMSKNDENTVIGSKIGALHGQYDADIFGITGLKKNDGEKSYDYAKRVITDYKAKADGKSEVDEELAKANTTIAKLQQQIEKGAGNDALAQQLKDSRDLVSQLQTHLADKTKALEEAEAKHVLDMKNVHLDYDFRDAMSGLKFKSGITDSLQATLLAAAKAEILSKGTPDFINDNGKQRLVFRDTDGNIINNPKTNLSPYTVKEMLMETSIKDALDTRRVQTGGGTNAGGVKGKNVEVVDLTSVKTQIEADNVISNYLLSNGLTRDSVEFAEKALQMREDNNISSLPIR